MLNYWVNASLRFKFLSILLFIILLSGSVSAIVITRNQVGLWQQFFQDKGSSLARYVADISKGPLLNRDRMSLDDIVDKINNDPDVLYAVVFDKSGQPQTNLFASINLRQPFVKEILTAGSGGMDITAVATAIKRRGPVFETRALVAIGDQVLGHVLVGVSEEKMIVGTDRIIRGIILANVIAFLLAGFLLLLFQRYFIHPISELARLMARVSARREYSVHAKVHSHDEVGILAQGFNDMLKQVHEHRQLLEKEVAQRTQELAGVNEALNWEKAGLERKNKELEQAQAKLIQSEKMASIGLLAAGIAHEINNPMGYIISNLDSMQDYVTVFEEVFALYDKLQEAIRRKDLSRAQACLMELQELKTGRQFTMIREDLASLVVETRSGALRVSKIVSDLKVFSRASEVKMALEDINHVMDFSFDIVHNEIKYKAEMIREYGALPKIPCSAPQISQVFINLLINALQSIKDKGKIEVRTFLEGAYVVIEVQDSGAGIPKEHLPHIFEPFFTTKELGKGTGLGLSIVYGIIEKHHGRIEVTSEEGKGTRFTVRLPVEQPKQT